MTLDKATHNLIGFADPLGKGIGFLIPVFASPGSSNSLRVEHVNRRNLVDGFVDLDTHDSKIWPARPSSSFVGAKPHWAFGFGNGEILDGIGDENRTKLRERINDDILAKRPLLALELADFLKLKTERIRIAKSAFERLQTITPKTATQWRDLSILTPDLRAALEKAIPKTERKRALLNLQRLIAVVRDDLVTLHGIEEKPAGHTWEVIDESTKKALKTLSSLYEAPRDGWRIRLAEIRPTDAPSHLRENPKALIYLSAEEERRSKHNEPVSRVDDLLVYPPGRFSDFVSQSSEPHIPNFILFNLDSQHARESLHPDSQELRKAVYIAVRSNADGLRSAEHYALEKIQNPTVVISGRFQMGRPMTRPTVSGETRDAINLLSALPSPYLVRELKQKASFFIRSKGTGPSELDDAWAQVYSRCWRLGVLGSYGVRFEIESESESDRRRRSNPSRICDLLFPNLKPIPVRPYTAANRATRMDAAVLVAADLHLLEHKEGIAEDYEKVVKRILRFQRWSIRQARDHTSPDLAIEGPRSSFDIQTKWNFRKRRAYSFRSLLERDLRQIRSLIATEDASAREILAALFNDGVLLVNIRDLSAFSAETGTIWMLLASQMRRFTRTMLGRSASQYFGLLIQVAIQQDNVFASETDVGKLIRAIHQLEGDDGSGITCSRVIYEDGRAIASLSFYSSDIAQRWSLKFFLEIEPTGVTLRQDHAS